MDNVQLSSISELTGSQKFALKKGGLLSVEDLLLMHPQDVKRKCRIEHSVYQSIMDTVCKNLNRGPRPLGEIAQEGKDTFTTGDSLLDEMLGGGLRTRMIWELVGEGASGKTQLALQLSLTVQLPHSQGGLHGRACYLRTHSSFPTPRLLEILTQHPLLASSPSCDLANILTIETKSVDMLQFVLSTKLPELLQQTSSPSSATYSTSTKPEMPVRLLVIDSLADLFADGGQSSTLTLVERSRSLSEISVMLHRLASEHQLAIVVVNNVVDVFSTTHDADTGQRGELIYNDQARFFGRADSLAGEDRKSAALGLVWANQINARIMLTRTGRRRYVDESEKVAVKRARPVGRLRPPNSSSSASGRSSTPQQQTAGSQDQTTLIRRLNIVFSSVCLPGWVDFVVTSQGVETLKGSSGRPVAQTPSSSRTQPSTAAKQASQPARPSSSAPLSVPGSSGPRMADVAMLDVAMAEQDLRALSPEPEQTFDDQPRAEEEEEEDAYWKEVDDIGGLDEAVFEMLDEGVAQDPGFIICATTLSSLHTDPPLILHSKFCELFHDTFIIVIMRATSFLVFIALAVHAAPSLAAPSAPSLAIRDVRPSILAARGGAATILEDGAEDAAKAVAKTSLGSTVKGAIADGLGTLLGGGVAGEILGGSNSSAKREVLEYIHARATEELMTRGGVATILEDGAEDAAKAVGKTSIGSTIKGAVADGVGTLLGGGIAGSILGNSDDSSSTSSKRELDARGGAATILEDGAKAVEKTTVGSTIKGAVADGVGTLLGGGIAGENFGNSDDSSSSSSKRELSARGGAATILEDGAKAVEKTSVGNTIKGAIADGVGTLLGGGIAGEIFGSSSDSSSSSSKRELSARGGAATIIEDGAKAAGKTSLGSTIKGAVADGVGTLLGGGIAGEIFGNSDDSSSSSKRELLEYIHARATEELAARGGAATILEDGAKAVEKTSIGSTIKGAVADGVGTLLGGGIAGEIFGNSDDSSSSSKRSLVRREYY